MTHERVFNGCWAAGMMLKGDIIEWGSVLMKRYMKMFTKLRLYGELICRRDR